MQIKKFEFNPFDENTYLIWDEETRETAVIDPGCYFQEEENEIEDYISNENLIIKYIINTHCHIDHIFGINFFVQKYNCDYYAPEKDTELLENANEQAKMMGLNFNSEIKLDKLITEDLILNLGNIKLTFIYTPGHTAGEFCIYNEKEKICLTGDVLFKQGIGRTDLWGGDYNTLMDSITKKLFTLPDEVVIYPGHGDKSEIGFEKSNNPFFRS